MTSLYSLRSASDPGQYTIIKFDHDYNPQETYALSAQECTCPAGPRPTCRHRKMLQSFLDKGHLNDGWFLDWDTRMWRKSLSEDNGFREERVAIDEPLLGKVEDAIVKGRQFGMTALHEAAITHELGKVEVSPPPPALGGVEPERPAPPPTLPGLRIRSLR